MDGAMMRDLKPDGTVDVLTAIAFGLPLLGLLSAVVAL